MTGPDPPPVFDPEAFEEVRDLLGTERAQARIGELARDLRTAFALASGGAPAPDRLLAAAHALAGRAGFLGFPELRDRCLALQDACQRGSGIDAALDRARSAAVRAGEEARRWQGPAAADAAPPPRPPDGG